MINETYATWLKRTVGEDFSPEVRYEIKVFTTVAAGSKPVLLQVDLIWFILLQVEEDDKVKLDVILALLQDPVYVDQFKSTMQMPDVKRVIAEFLLFNSMFLYAIKHYINFNILNVPVNFVEYALFIRYFDDIDTPEIKKLRITIVNLVLDSGFKLTADNPEKALGMTVRKVLWFDDMAQRFILVKRLLSVGFVLFGPDVVSNSEVAVLLINNRNNPECLEIIKQNLAKFNELNVRVAGNCPNSNLADYFYWVKEDMAAVSFIRDTLGIDISP